jgi:hypothetical protein
MGSGDVELFFGISLLLRRLLDVDGLEWVDRRIHQEIEPHFGFATKRRKKVPYHERRDFFVPFFRDRSLPFST